VAAALDAGRSVIADATHVRRDWRRKPLALARQRGAKRVAVWFDLPLEVCLARNAAKPGGGWGAHPVPLEVLTGMWRGLEPPGADEFDEVMKIRA
jgi:predicted kinase